MKILITGGAGFIGANLAAAVLAAGHEVVIVDDLSTGAKENLDPSSTFVEMSIADARLVDVFAQHQPQAVVHLAAQIDVRKSVEDPVADANINIAGSLNLLEAARKHGVRRFVFASSGGAIYGDTDVRPTPETFWPAPISPYGIAKWTLEHYLHFYRTAYGLSYAALRYANVYGPRQSTRGEAGVVAVFISRLLAGQDISVWGSGEQTRDFVFVGDIVAANVAALESDFVGALNIGTGVETSVNTVAQTLHRLTESAAAITHIEAKLGEQQASCVDNRLAKEKLGWTPSVGIEEGLQRTVEWFRSR